MFDWSIETSSTFGWASNQQLNAGQTQARSRERRATSIVLAKMEVSTYTEVGVGAWQGVPLPRGAVGLA